MSEIINSIGTGLLGGAIGLFSGIFIARKLGLTPSARELRSALADNEEHYKTMLARMRGRMKEYEQPSELQSLASYASGASNMKPEDLVNLFVDQISSVRGLPKWVRPMLPGIIGWAKEHPEQIQGLIAKFTSGSATKTADQEFKDSL